MCYNVIALIHALLLAGIGLLQALNAHSIDTIFTIISEWLTLNPLPAVALCGHLNAKLVIHILLRSRVFFLTYRWLAIVFERLAFCLPERAPTRNMDLLVEDLAEHIQLHTSLLENLSRSKDLLVNHYQLSWVSLRVIKELGEERIVLLLLSLYFK